MANEAVSEGNTIISINSMNDSPIDALQENTDAPEISDAIAQLSSKGLLKDLDAIAARINTLIENGMQENQAEGEEDNTDELYAALLDIYNSINHLNRPVHQTMIILRNKILGAVPETAAENKREILLQKARQLEARGLLKESEFVYLSEIIPCELSQGPDTSESTRSSIHRLRNRMSRAVGISRWPQSYKDLSDHMRAMIQFCPIAILIEYSRMAVSQMDYRSVVLFQEEILKVESHRGRALRVYAEALYKVGRTEESVRLVESRVIPAYRRINEDTVFLEPFLEKMKAELAKEQERNKNSGAPKSQKAKTVESGNKDEMKLDATNFGSLLTSAEKILVSWYRDPTMQGRSWYKIPDADREAVSEEFQKFALAIKAHFKSALKNKLQKQQEQKFLKTLDAVLDHISMGQINLDALQRLKSMTEDLELMGTVL